MPQNIELKARLASLDGARAVARRLATGPSEEQHQVDTYFFCRSGRLKLREITGRRNELIWYERPDQEQAKACRYLVVRVDDAAGLKQALTSAWGIRCIVEKYREIYLYQNVRIHLDRVVDLDAFLEFEAVLGPDADAQTGHAQLAFLRGQFQIADADLLTGSYADLLAS
ncbi:MAG: class IV adenylate cyclase [Candidatus Anammoximicrobium sp.]|nr:class IV adenylate cyclase [Candidatus Anammoximicrobium sp.]